MNTNNMTETAIKTSIQKVLKKAGVWELKVNPSGRMRAGVPDLLCCYLGRFVAFEVKRSGGKPTKLQEHEIKKIQEAGGMAFVVTSAKTVIAILESIKGDVEGECHTAQRDPL